MATEDLPNGKNARINMGQSKNTLQGQNEKPTQKPISIYSDPIDRIYSDPIDRRLHRTTIRQANRTKAKGRRQKILQMAGTRGSIGVRVRTPYKVKARNQLEGQVQFTLTPLIAPNGKNTRINWGQSKYNLQGQSLETNSKANFNLL